MSVPASKKNLSWLLGILALSILLRLFFIGQQDLLVEEAYYWDYGTHLDFGYLDHPPLVAILIKLSTALFGINEFGVRFPAFLCWLIIAYFSYRWTELIQKGAGIYAILLISILPGFAIFSLLMTPDIILMAAWSAGLYWLYLATCCENKKAWYYAGIALGLGLLGKYSTALLIFTTGIYLLATPANRKWFLRKEPYLALIITLVLFSPVIYWNAIHDWASFAFQSTRRLEGGFRVTFHYFLGLIVLFLTPVGIIGLIQLLTKKYTFIHAELNKATIYFFRYYTLIPLAIFGAFSLTREIKFDWIAPVFLAMIPWLAILAQSKIKILEAWLTTAIILIIGYTAILFCITFGQPEIASRTFFGKAISWENFTQQFYDIAEESNKKGEQPVFIPIDNYGLSAELEFYQAKKLQQGTIAHVFPVHGADIFGFNSLMFDYWYKFDSLQNKTIIFIGKLPDTLNNPAIQEKIIPLSPITILWGKSQGEMIDLKEYSYQLAKLKD